MPLCVNSNSIAPKLCNELPVNYSTYWFWAVQNGTETAIAILGVDLFSLKTHSDSYLLYYNSLSQ